jgi:hypothetical protein
MSTPPLFWGIFKLVLSRFAGDFWIDIAAGVLLELSSNFSCVILNKQLTSVPHHITTAHTTSVLLCRLHQFTINHEPPSFKVEIGVVNINS